MPHERATDTERLRKALKWLSNVRQAPVAAETASAYAVGLQDLPIHALEQAIRDIGYRARAEYETAWPDLGTIRARCDAILRVERERQEAKKLLTGKAPDPISPEQWADIKARFQAVIGKKVMR